MLQDELATLFRETGVAHHQAFAASNGDDPHWHRWYAEYLLPRLADLVGRSFSYETLAAELVQLDAAYREAATDEPWAEFYARGIAQGGTS